MTRSGGRSARKSRRWWCPISSKRLINDGLGFGDIEMAIARGRIRRRFTHDPRGTRYEVVGPTTDGRKVAVICRVKGTGTLLLVTTYLVE